MLMDDPTFDLDARLPEFDFDADGNLLLPQESQVSRKTSSQFSPLQRDSMSSGGRNSSVLDGLDLPPSSPGGRSGSSQLQAPFGRIGLPDDKNDLDLMLPRDVDDRLSVVGDWGIEIDDDGNVMPFVETPELPQLPRPAATETAEPAHDSNVAHHDDELVIFDDQGDVVMGGANAQAHEVEKSPVAQQQTAEDENEEEVVSEEVVAPVRKRAKRKKITLSADHETKLSRQEIKDWWNTYLDDADEERMAARLKITPFDAKKNAFNFVFGRGIGDIGYPVNLPDFTHPLAHHFAGDGLRSKLFGFAMNEDDEILLSKGRRRSALEALELEEDDDPADGERRVRRRVSEEDEEHARQVEEQLNDKDNNARALLAGNEEEAEVGRKAGSALPDLPSDIAPWNRGSSQVPGSSVKGDQQHPGSRHVSASPLPGRSRAIADIERLSDQPHFGSDGYNNDPQLLHSYSDDYLAIPDAEGLLMGSQAGADASANNTSQAVRDALDSDGRNFIGFLEKNAIEKGVTREEDDDNIEEALVANKKQERKWLTFDDLLQGNDGTRSNAAQAFHHILALATKNAIRVEQDGQYDYPFGEIRMGVMVEV